MTYLNTICFVLSAFSLLGQEKLPVIKLTAPKAESYWDTYTLEREKKIGLPSLRQPDGRLHFRLWENNQITDITVHSKDSVSAILIRWADERVPDKEKPTNRTFVLRDTLAPGTAKNLKLIFEKSGILDLPSEEDIIGWSKGFDGVTYIIQNSDGRNYHLKSYWTPQVQEKVKEAMQVWCFVKNCELFIDANSPKDFHELVPYELYYNGGSYLRLRALTKKQRKTYREEREAYRKAKGLN